MISKDMLRDIVTGQKSGITLARDTVRREVLNNIMRWFGDNRIFVLTGIRRSGKSTLLKQIMREKGGFCYVNFEDERFIDFRAQDFESLNEVLIEIYGKPGVYFFDEIQNIEKFELFVRRLHEQGMKVIITGSNASLLSKEFGTRLTGRYRQFEVYPFSFSEYLTFNGIHPEKDWFHLAEKKIMLLKLFDGYVYNGGMPEYLKNKDIEYIRTVYENIIYRDVIARYAIRRQKVVKELVNILASNISSKFTYNSLRKSLNLSNAITVKEYVSYLGNSYMFFELLKFDFSVKRQLNSPRKIYMIDPAFSRVAGMSLSPDRGKVLENIVFIELKRRGKEVYYYSGMGECDFIVKEGAKISEAVQVCYEMNESNRQRELSGLLEAMDKFKLKRGLILTKEQEEDIVEGSEKIKVMPVWKWLLGFR